MKKEFDLQNTLRTIETYCDEAFYDDFDVKKVFYKVEEWASWRFYLKALHHWDWPSIVGHIKSNFTTHE